MDLRDEHFEAFLALVFIYKKIVLFEDMQVMANSVQEALKASPTSVMGCYIWKKRKVTKRATESGNYSEYMRLVGYLELEAFCREYNWDYEMMEDKWEDLRTDPLG